MRHVLDIINQIKNTSGRNDKEKILKDNADNVELKQLLKYVYDPFYIYGIQSKKLNKFLKQSLKESGFSYLFEVFEYLLQNPNGRDKDVQKVATFISQSPEELQPFYIDCITKSLTIGCSATTLNKVFGKGFINKFEVQLAKKFEDEEHKIRGKEFVITEKLDGMRCVAIVEDAKVKFFSRQGQPIEELIEIEECMMRFPDGVYDGELLIHNAGNYKDRDVLQETLKIARRDAEKRGLVFHIFDLLAIEEFKTGKSKQTYIKRREKLIELHKSVPFDYVDVVPVLYQGKDLSVIPSLLADMNKQGKEGLMLNVGSGLYVCKRTDQLLKIKSMNEFDEMVVDVVEGKGEDKGKLGAVVVNYKGQYPLKVGSGFTDKEREYYWDHKDEIIGRVIAIQYFRESRNADGGLSVSFPVFLQVRTDKDEPSYH